MDVDVVVVVVVVVIVSGRYIFRLPRVYKSLGTYFCLWGWGQLYIYPVHRIYIIELTYSIVL